MAIDTAGIAAAATAQGGTQQADPSIVAALERIEANRKVQPETQPRVDTEGIANAAASQNANQVAAEQKTAEVVVGGPIAASTGPVEQKPIDNGADPYVSNGQSTIPPTVEEKKDIKPSDDAQVAKTAQEKLEAEQESARAKLKAEETKAGNPEGNWTAGSVDKVRTQQAVFVARNSIQKDDWRVRLSLAPSAKYLYKAAKSGDILYPLAATDGVIFPYSPTIQTAYRANYDPLDLMHSNYKLHFYKNSNVDEITVTADFTAQDTTEANYLLAVIHFFKSVTKMFYGQDGNNGPKAGTPPPLCYLNGYGQYQFNEHPCLVSNFTYNLPNDVDYIRAGSPTVVPGTNTNGFSSEKKKGFSFSDLFSLSKLRAQGSRLKTNSISAEPAWKNYSNENATYVPTKMQIQLSLIPVVTRNDISKNFSLEKYATGALLKGRTRSGGGMW